MASTTTSTTSDKRGLWETLPQIIQRTFSNCPDAAAKLVIVIYHNLREALELDEGGKVREDRKIWIHVVENWLTELKLVRHASWSIKSIAHAFKTGFVIFQICFDLHLAECNNSFICVIRFSCSQVSNLDQEAGDR